MNNVRMPHECLGIAAVIGAGRDPEAGLGREAKSLDDECRVESVLQASRNPGGLSVVVAALRGQPLLPGYQSDSDPVSDTLR